MDTIIHGAARGADTCAGMYARNHNKEELSYPALWELYGKRAGPIRNKQMLDEGKPDLVVAFLSNVAIQEIFYGLHSQHSRGTRNMIEQATKAGIPVKIVNIANQEISSGIN